MSEPLPDRQRRWISKEWLFVIAVIAAFLGVGLVAYLLREPTGRKGLEGKFFKAEAETNDPYKSYSVQVKFEQGRAVVYFPDGRVTVCAIPYTTDGEKVTVEDSNGKLWHLTLKPYDPNNGYIPSGPPDSGY